MALASSFLGSSGLSREIVTLLIAIGDSGRSLAPVGTLAISWTIESGFENAEAPGYNDTLAGAGNANRINGGKGDDALLGGLDALACLREPEIDELHVALEGDQDVLRRDIAMHDVDELTRLVARLVRAVQPEEHAVHDGGDDLDRDRARRAGVPRSTEQA